MMKISIIKYVICTGMLFFGLHCNMLAQCTVNTLSDDPGASGITLRAAITSANSGNCDYNGTNTILFDDNKFPETGVQVIELSAPLPPITYGVEILADLASANPNADDPHIIIKGNYSIDVGLTVNFSDGTTVIDGLIFSHFNKKGIYLADNLGTTEIRNCIFGKIYDVFNLEGMPYAIHIENDNNLVENCGFNCYLNGWLPGSGDIFGYVPFQRPTNGSAIFIDGGEGNVIGTQNMGNYFNFLGVNAVEVKKTSLGNANDNDIQYCNFLQGWNLSEGHPINIHYGESEEANSGVVAPSVTCFKNSTTGQTEVTITTGSDGGTVQIYEDFSWLEDQTMAANTTQTFYYPYIYGNFEATVTDDTKGTSQLGYCWSSNVHPYTSPGDPVSCSECASFLPVPGETYIISAWVKEEQVANTAVTYEDAQLIISFEPSGLSTFTFSPSGRIIDGWQRIEGSFTIPSSATDIYFELANESTATGDYDIYFDDIRIHPVNANLKSFVYDPVTLKLMAEMDENNYATFYEYNEEGQLIRIKKETERGRKTIQESFNHTSKK